MQDQCKLFVPALKSAVSGVNSEFLNFGVPQFQSNNILDLGT